MKTVETLEQLDALPVWTVLRHVDDEEDGGAATVMEKAPDGQGIPRWYVTGSKYSVSALDYLLPAMILWSPT